MNIFWFLLAKFKDQILKGLLFLILGIVVIVILAQFTNFPQVLALVFQSLGRVSLLVLVFLSIYYLIKFQLERFLILKLSLAVTGKRIALLFATAELVREFPTVPILMAISATTKQGEKFFPIRMFASLAPQLPLEIAACFLILALFGFRNLPYLQLVSLLAVLGIFIFLLLLKKIPIPKFLQSGRNRLKQKIFKVLTNLKVSLAQILTLPNLTISFLFTFTYLLCLGTVLYLVGTATGVVQLNLTQAWSIFALIYIAIVFSPMPADWGVSESSGFVLLSAIGAERESALASMLTFRIIFSSATYLVTGAIFWFLWSDIRDFVLSFFKSEKS